MTTEWVRREGAHDRNTALADDGGMRAATVPIALVVSLIGISFVLVCLSLAIEALDGGLAPRVLVLGLAAHGGSDRTTAIEHLTDEIRRVATDLESESEPARSRLEDGEFAVDRTDEVGRLADAVDELTAAMAERERRYEETERRRQELYRIASDASLQGEAKLRRLLEFGCEQLGLETGFVSRIDEEAERYEIEVAVGAGDERFEEGEAIPLSKHCCRETISSDGVLGIHDAEAEGRDDHPTDEDLDVGCYIGGTVPIGDERYGTLCFMDREPRPGAFTASDRSFVELMMRWASHVLERRQYTRLLREREARLERSQQFTDDMLDAVDDLVYVLDEDGTIKRWNESLIATTDYSEAEIETMHATDFFDGADRQAVGDAIEEVLETGHARIEVEIVTKSGDRVPYEFVASALEDPDGELVVAGIGRDVSEHKEKERRLREREQRLERYAKYTDDVLDAIDDMFYVLDETGDLQRWNESLVEVTGYSDDEIEGMNALDFFDETEWDAVQRSMEEAFETGDTRVEAELVTKAGERTPYEFIASVLEEPDGNLVEAGIGRDISERKERERQLRERERRLERTTHMLEQSQRLADVGAWELDVTVEPYDLHWTDEVARIHGFPPDADPELEQALETCHPEDRRRVREAIERAIETGTEYDLEIRLQTPDGERRWIRSIGEPIAEDGEVVMVRGSVQDITERKERERERERSETIIQALDELVYTVDEDGRFQFVNDASRSFAGYDPEELIGTHFSSVMTDRDVTTARDRVRELLRADEPSRTLEMDLVTKDGDVIEVENHMALLPMPDGEFAGTAGVVRDITRRKERERDLERTTDLLERVQRMASVGGWALDLRTDPPRSTWTEELYRLHDLPRDAEIDLETILDCYHPADQSRVRRTVEEALENGTAYDLEARMTAGSDDINWVHAIGEPIYEGGDLTKFRGSIQDVTDQKRRELALESLHETARGLLNAETESAVAELVVETADELFENSGISVYALDSETNRLKPTASTAAFVDRFDGGPSVAVGNGDSVLWNTYVTGGQTVVDDTRVNDRSPLFGGDVEGGLLVPIGDHGVFVLLAPPATIDDEMRQLVETLVATTEAAFGRLESEAALRAREAELAERNRRLNRQVAITEIIRRIDQSLIGAESRAEIERAVTEQLVEANNVSFAWIGALDASGATLEPRAWAGSSQEYLDTVSLASDGSSEPAVRTARTETPTVVGNVVEGLQGEPWRTHALDQGFQSVVSVPLVLDEYTYGVLTVYADEPDAYTDLERTVFAELGEGIANAINAVKTREALHAETLLELTLRIGNADDVLSRIASTTGARVEYEGLGTHTADETLLFFVTRGAPPADVRAALDDLVSVTDYRLLSDSDGSCRFEATVAGDVLASRLVRHGGSPRSMHADETGTELTVDVPVRTDVREFVEMLSDHYADVELRARRHVERTMQTKGQLVASLFDALTDRQLEVLRTAYFAGFFEWPRESTGEEIAGMLEVTQPTVNRHLRLGQQRLLAQLFETENPTVLGS